MNDPNASACGACSGCELPSRNSYLPLSRLPDDPIDKTASERRGDFSPPYRYPFLLGVYLATNAIPDAAAIVDGPDCLFFKAEVVHGKHDLNSTLLRVDGRHRIVTSHVYTDNLALEKGQRVEALLRQLEGSGLRAAFVSALPMVSIIGTDYDKILRDVGSTDQLELIEVPGRSLQGDWLAGYSDVLQALARGLTLPDVPLRPEAVAVVGNLFERNEQDHLGNVRELRRMVAGLGLDLVTVWLGGESVQQLARVAEAKTILALPMGRKAARILADRTGATVVEVDTPFGLGRTRRFLTALAGATGTRAAADAFVDAELRAAIPPLEWLVPHAFLGKRVAFSGTPDLIPGFLQLAADLGMDVVHLSSPTTRPSWLGDLDEFGPTPPIFFDVSNTELRKEVWRLANGDADLLIGCSGLRRYLPERLATVELGFPSYTHHALHDAPHLGFRGFLSFVQRMANAIESRSKYLV